MASTVSSAFLNQLRSLYPARSGASGAAGGGSLLSSPWYILAAVAFSASNKPDAVPRVFEHALNQFPTHEGSSHAEDRRQLARKLREALFKSGLISGYPRAINSLRALHEAMPDDLKDTELQRDPNLPLSEYQQKGQVYWDSVYGETAPAVQGLLDAIYPDMGWFSKTIGYGLVYNARPDILSPLETSFTLVAALIAGDTPQQIAWHLKGALRCGASVEEIHAARKIAIEVAKHSGVQWRNPVPEIEL
ncbi:hypothetical protein CC1G_13987 [Coprinopsis cinerea okayama7|uniref:Carboxymuconolactone decarboxylase-like domain-containing protein n=1 Tax=Coprinopsis cinerea (strain Okayama-7 / 130 / ATCC MYA-4618 / FGSC 9003) TaxID=240176 RepID=D6RKZ4_COPC7|nr:hypothetical protein CC1G_13987 [Coprinopsis cinerea okayama7\|eukprot:XP_002911948.1 hypothetical protein CC1G_13987 [Coprinopsis cinerea okayama7\